MCPCEVATRSGAVYDTNSSCTRFSVSEYSVFRTSRILTTHKHWNDAIYQSTGLNDSDNIKEHNCLRFVRGHCYVTQSYATIWPTKGHASPIIQFPFFHYLQCSDSQSISSNFLSLPSVGNDTGFNCTVIVVFVTTIYHTLICNRLWSLPFQYDARRLQWWLLSNLIGLNPHRKVSRVTARHSAIKEYSLNLFEPTMVLPYSFCLLTGHCQAQYDNWLDENFHYPKK